MSTFLIGAVLIGLVVFLGLLWPLLRARGTAPSERRAVLAVYRQRLGELGEQRAAGLLADTDHDVARAELEAQLASELGRLDAHEAPTRAAPAWLSALLLLLAVPAATLWVYQHTGGYTVALEAADLAATRAAQREPVERLASRLRQRPDDVEGWWLLGRSWLELGEPARAVAALAQAYTFADPNPELAFDYARALAELNENRLTGAPARILETNLSRFPDDSRLLWLAAMLSLEQGRRDEALERLDRLMGGLPEGSEDLRRLATLRARIAEGMGGPPQERDEAEARTRAESGNDQGAPAAGATTEAAGVAGAGVTTEAAAAGVEGAGATTRTLAASVTDAGAPAAGPEPVVEKAGTQVRVSVSRNEAPGQPSPIGVEAGAQVRVSVSLDPSLAAQAAPGDSVFVFARAIDGPPMPLAVARARVADLPLEVTLDDSLAMAPQFRLSSAARVAVGARISRSGQAMPASGDIDGHAEAPVDPRAPGATARVVLQRIVP